MSDLPAIITAATALVGLGGGAVRFIWNKIEKRFVSIETELGKCEVRERESQERRAVQLTAIELLWSEVKRFAPESHVLVRVKRLLDDLKRRGDQQEDLG